MNQKATKHLWHVSLVLFLLFVVMSQSGSSAADGENSTWSFEFNNMPISDVLGELSRTTGIDIFSNQLPANRTLSKHFVNQTIDKIVKDVFKGVSFALVWHHGQGGIRGLDIWVFEGGSGPSMSFSNVERRPPPRISPFPHKGKAGSTEEREDDSGDADEADDNSDQLAPQSLQPGEEREQKSSDSVGEFDMESAADAENQPEAEADEDVEADSPLVPIKTPDFE